MTEKRPAHSPLGASGAERWMACPGSVRLLQALNLPETDEPDYRREGTAAHAALEWCLRERHDAWEAIGQKFEGVECDRGMADAISAFLGAVELPEHKQFAWIEYQIDDPEFHPQFFGKLDYGYVGGMGFDTLVVNDFKYGQGVIVEVWHNPQIMYYAYGLLRYLDRVRIQKFNIKKVKLRIVQPRAYHPDGPVREWEVDADVIRNWARDVLLPAMKRTDEDPALWPGEHCRFCPAKLVCPAMHGLVEAAVDADPAKVIEWDNDLADQTYPLVGALEHFIKAVKDDVYRRLNTGTVLTHAKLVHKKANRVFKPEAKAALEAQIDKKDLYTVPELKSPAEIEKISPLAKHLVHEYAYTPESGLTVAPISDKRPAVKVTTTEEAFAAYLNGERK